MLLLARLAAVLEHFAIFAVQQWNSLHWLLPVKKAAVCTLVQLSRKIPSFFELNRKAGSHFGFQQCVLNCFPKSLVDRQPIDVMLVLAGWIKDWRGKRDVGEVAEQAVPRVS